MDIRYYLDPETGQPHIYDHGITEAEVEWILARSGEDGPSSGGTRQSIGQTDQAVVTVPVELLPEVRRLLAAYKPKSA